MIAITLDPGVTTGFVFTDITEHSPIYVTAGQERWQHEGFFNMLHEWTPDIIVYEGFFYRRNLGNAELFPRELIGIIHLYAANPNSPGVVLYEQNPSQKEGHFKNKDRIKELDLWVPSCPHGMDAMRHFLMWWTFGSGYQYNKGQRLCLS